MSQVNTWHGSMQFKLFVIQIQVSILHSLRQSQGKSCRIFLSAGIKEIHLVSKFPSVAFSQTSPAVFAAIWSCSRDLFQMTDWYFTRFRWLFKGVLAIHFPSILSFPSLYSCCLKIAWTILNPINWITVTVSNSYEFRINRTGLDSSLTFTWKNKIRKTLLLHYIWFFPFYILSKHKLS